MFKLIALSSDMLDSQTIFFKSVKNTAFYVRRKHTANRLQTLSLNIVNKYDNGFIVYEMSLHKTMYTRYAYIVRKRIELSL